MNISATERHILAEIVRHKQQEVAQMQQKLTFTALQQQLPAAVTVRNFLTALHQHPAPSLIAEVKKASPSRGIIRTDFDPVAIAQGYERGGAACLSVLTDEKFFQGSFENLRTVRAAVTLPLLCKEFIIDPYQIYLARTAGADAILLIAAILTDSQIQEFMDIIHALGMNALMEVHTLAELHRVLKLKNLRLLGINNRNLEDFRVDLQITQQLLTQCQQQIQKLNITVVSESGLYKPADLSFVAHAGARAVLVGESLVKQNDPEQAVRSLLNF
ncbi:indole-3-glycerol phosphate synthase TrpC [Umezakia ovalisporum]|jgi:indole-3-glycerol phosphate synthase|uniref:Indole-3-glycerol phosphate synthase n=2 Tax=Umezakia ovalisporum TaxID=75695 RepID=A0AA43GW66_9CYAN|nr:indole-3-glycerol phosphate synthase TrpC [Umezakia ovalisporum]MDH6057557.1 indole-3-glycerol phosphate synthase TrpC [Umezakia ovalisporum FSS-43]MDH6062827.1 indole-3-glycerol phosphate synthase TrpC [Umezakia ovalisporum FSS-62]MDH6069087.1 indole-3-glycerol phosphate synthase TrpC [Umezakia ovalisporum APH033B]MDH6070725.1 indole-3-glycerol phosphate synthase TrpC [Umezakia ovalisporum CobakiLakeA]MDH6073906.1 indole-3-glycerol phosphate synthase TrpC [Umezakia ovalisporum CS-1034]